MFEKERDYRTVVEILVPVLHDLPGKIIAIGGLPGVGKTSLGRFLAYRFNVSLIETDLFLIRDQGKLIYSNGAIEQAIAARIAWSRPVIIEGCVVLRLLRELNRQADFTIHVTNKDAPESEGGLLKELESYERDFNPAATANFQVEFDGCD